jgi:TRAP-type uncharacterized transport system substrate-binding protein
MKQHDAIQCAAEPFANLEWKRRRHKGNPTQMLTFAANHWPRWTRIALVFLVGTAAAGGGLLIYQYFTKPIFLTIAVGSADGEGQSLISAISARLAETNAHVRLKVVDAGNSLGASIMLSSNKAELAVVRGDTENLSDARTVLRLTQAVVLLLVPSSNGADSLGELRNVTIGVVGGENNKAVVDALKQVYQFDRAKVRFQDVPVAGSAAALSSGQANGLLAVVPITEAYLTKVKQFFQQNSAKLPATKLIEIESAGAVANIAQYYESYDIPKGTLRGAPPIPSEDLTSLRVSFFVVASKSVNDDTIANFTHSLIDVRRDLLAEHPILAQASAPSTDADALIPIHPGAAAYYAGEQRSFLDRYSDKLYYGSMLGGSLLSIILAAWRFTASNSVPESMLEKLYELGDEIKHANSELELERIEGEIDNILKAELACGDSGDEADSSNMAALTLAAQRLQYLMALRRSQIHATVTASN